MTSVKLNQIKAGFLNNELTIKIIEIKEFKKQSGEKCVKILLGQRTSRIEALAFPKVGIEFTKKYTVGQSVKFPSGTFIAKKRDKKYQSKSTCNFDLTFVRVPHDAGNQNNGNNVVSNVSIPQAGTSGSSSIKTDDFNAAAERIKKRGAFSSNLSSIVITSGEVYRYLGCSECSKRVDKSDKDGKYRCSGKSCKKRGSKKWVETTAKICVTIRNVTISNSNGNLINGIVIFDKHANKLLEIDDVNDFKDDNEICSRFTKLLNATIDAKLRRNNVKSGSNFAPPLMLEEINVKELAKVVTPIQADLDSDGEDSDGWFADEGEEIINFGKKKKKRQDKIDKELGTSKAKVGIKPTPYVVNVVKDAREQNRKDLDFTQMIPVRA
ncbi:uncharacterized protein LOC118433953 [Folsomia candida]|uniref:uncharacterized protein LOC118433953 n=1 Tax=Folsomia candida TaxID=158441 RepID=UPI0016054EB1|nr:uncharacterized protein LOC118433953 [Folsomia candida]